MVSAAFLACDKPLPIPAGKSPFGIKGEFYRQIQQTQQRVEERHPGVLAKLLARDGLLDFTRQSFLASVFYDVLPLPRIIMCFAEAAAKDVRELTKKIGTTGIEQQLASTYAVLFTRLTTANVHQRFPQLLEHLYDHAPATMTPIDHGCKLVRPAVPLCIAEWWNIVSVPFLQVPLEKNGCTGFTVTQTITEAGSKDGVPLANLDWTLHWA
jgi:hypothetical protein